MEDMYRPQKSGNKTVLIVVIVIMASVLVVIAGVFFAGVLFLWTASFTEENGIVENLNLDAEIDSQENVLILTVISGTVDWSEYSVIVDQGTILTPESYTETSAGKSKEFSDPSWDPEFYMEYNFKIVDIVDNVVEWYSDIMAT